MRSGCGGREERLERRRIVPAECGCGGREERLYAGSVLAAFLPFGNAVHTV